MIMQGDANQACEDEILLLQEEIQELTQKFKKNQAEIASLSSANIKKAMQSCHEILIPNHERITDTTSIIAQIGENEEELQFLNSLSGIVFTQYSKKVKHRNNQVMNKHRLVGNCQFLSFQMEFQIMDNKTKEDTCRFIDDLNIIMECREQSDLSKFVSRVEERRNLLLFFRTLSKFAEWSEYRKNTFVQFKEKYPSAVRFPAGSSAEYMILSNPNVPGFELLLMWRIHIDDQGRVIPILDLLPKIPEQAIALDKKGVVEGTAPGFRNLLQAFGIQGSIDNLIQSFCLSETDASD